MTKADPIRSVPKIYHSLFHVHLPPEALQNNPQVQKVITIHDLIPWFFPEYYLPSTTDQRNVLKAAERGWIIAPSESTRRDLITHFKVDPSRVFVTHLGVSKEHFYLREDLPLLQQYGLEDQSYFIYVGRLEERKGITLLLQAFSELVQQEKIKNLKLLLCGPLKANYSDLHWNYEHYIRKKGLEKQVVHIPFAPDQDLPTLYSHAIALTFLSEYEGFGFPPLEAMHCHTPSICLDNSSLPEVVGEAGILLKETKIETIANSLYQLYRKPELRKKLSKRGVLHSEKFSWENTTRQTLEAYQSILNA